MTSVHLVPDSPAPKRQSDVPVPLLSVRNLTVSFAQRAHGWFGVRRPEPVPVVKGISFDIAPQSMVALVGESGSGKSVTATAIMGLLPRNASVGAASGIAFAGRELLKAEGDPMRALRGKEIAMIFQEPMSSLNPVLTVGYQIGEVLRRHKKLSRKAARQRAIALLGEVGISSPETRIDAYPSQLSGGQQQRVMIAMAVACEPKLLIADEPTTALDVTVQKQIMELLRRLQQTYRMSVLFITHDLGLVGESADQVVVLRHGEVQEQGPVARIFVDPAHPYTKALLHCRPRVDLHSRRLPVIADYLGVEAAGAFPGVDSGYPSCATAPTAFTVPTAPSGRPLLEVRGLSKSFSLRSGLFGRQALAAVRDISFDLQGGRTLGVVGESGSGKSTLGLTLLRLHRADAGQVRFDGEDVLAMSDAQFAPYKRRMQIIFQNPYASLNPRFNIGQILREPMRIHGIGVDDEERHVLAARWLDRVGLPEDALQRYPHEFSGGQRQRIAIARCLTMQPDVLVCDESVSALDVSVQAQVLNLLRDLQDEFGLSYIFISHDLAVIRHIADQVLVMREGEAVESGPADELFAQPAHAYTQALLSAIPRGLG